MKDKFKIACLILFLSGLLVYSFYIHRTEPHWFETKYVKIIK